MLDLYGHLSENSGLKHTPWGHFTLILFSSEELEELSFLIGSPICSKWTLIIIRRTGAI
jgi:hypothetical protein